MRDAWRRGQGGHKECLGTRNISDIISLTETHIIHYRCVDPASLNWREIILKHVDRRPRLESFVVVYGNFADWFRDPSVS